MAAELQFPYLSTENREVLCCPPWGSHWQGGNVRKMTSLVFINNKPTDELGRHWERERAQRLDNHSRPPCPTEDAMCREAAQAFSHPTLTLQGRRDPRAAPPMPGD